MGYLLVIDQTPTPDKNIAYFKAFDIDIRQITSLDIPDSGCLGVLIDWNILSQQPEMIQSCYQRCAFPILVTHATRDETIVIQALESGADDFIVKPWQPRELQARLAAISRRIARQQQISQPQKEVICFDDWRVYPQSRQVFHAGQSVELSAGEFDLLLLLLRHGQNIVGREQFNQLNKVNSSSPLDRRIDVQISRLRQKIEPQPDKPTYIKTIRNLGYLFTARVLFLQESEME